MRYLIRFEVRRAHSTSPSEFQEVWHRRDPVLPQGPCGVGIVQSFKVVGRQTVFAVAEFSDHEALDEALAGLPIVEEFGSDVEIEVIPVRSYDRPEAPRSAATDPAEEPARPQTVERSNEDARAHDTPGVTLDKPEEKVGSEDTGQEEPTASAEPERSEYSQAPTSAGRSEEAITGIVRSLDASAEPEKPAMAGAGETTQPETGRAPARSEARQPAGPVLGLEGASGRAKETEPPEEPGTATGSKRSPADEDELSPTLAEGSITGMIRGLNVAAEAAQPEIDQDKTPAPPAQPRDNSITGMIRSLDAPERQPEGSEGQAPAPAISGTTSATRALLRCVSGPASGGIFEVGRAGATIGRSNDSSLQLLDEKLSRHHARIEFEDRTYWVKDLGSSNGTFVNQARLSGRRRLNSGDVIGLGSTRLKVTLKAEPVS